MSTKEQENNYRETCRVCLKEENLQSLKDKYENVDISEMLRTCLSIQFNETDGLPQKICVTCVNELAQAYKLSKKFQNTENALREKLPQPIAIIRTVEPDTNEDEFVLPDKTIDKKHIEIGNKSEFILIDRNIIKKIKDHDGRVEVPSPSYGLTQAKMRIINAKSNVVDETFTRNSLIRRKTNSPTMITNPSSKLKDALLNTKKPVNISLQLKINNRSSKETPGKINILNIQPYNTKMGAILSDNNRNIKKLQMNSVLTNKNTGTPKIITNNKIETNKNVETPKMTTKNKIETNKNVETPKIKRNKNHDDIKKSEIINKLIEDEKDALVKMTLLENKKQITRTSGKVRKISNRKSDENGLINKDSEEIKMDIENQEITSTTNEIPETETTKEVENNNLKETNSNVARKNKHKWNTHNKIHKNYRNKRLKKKKKVFFYSSQKFHEQFEKFLTTNKDEGVKEMPEEKIPEIKERIKEKVETQVKPIKKEETIKEVETQVKPETSTLSGSHLKTTEIKNKLVTGYVRRFQDIKECPICKKCFKYLEPHLRIHTSKELASLKELNIKKEEKLLQCRFCDRKFYHKDMLANHEKIHEDKNKKFVCAICDRGFKEMSALRRHHSIHTQNNLYPCNICKKTSYNIKSNLYRHQRVCATKNTKRQNRET